MKKSLLLMLLAMFVGLGAGLSYAQDNEGAEMEEVVDSENSVSVDETESEDEPVHITVGGADSTDSEEPAEAEVEEEEDVSKVEVVVTGTKKEEGLMESPIKTFLVSEDDMNDKNALTLADALEQETGVRVGATCQNCGAPEVRLIGLEGGYNQILINGMPLVSSLAGVYFLEQLPSELIEQIEIVKGGGSSLYGGNAVAGVVNIITEKPTETGMIFSTYLGGMDDTRGSLIPFWKVGFSSTYASDDIPFAGAISGSFSERGFYDRDGDGFTEIPIYKNESVCGDFYWEPTADDSFHLNIIHLHEYRRGGDQINMPAHKTLITESGDFLWNSVIFSYERQLSLTSMFRVYSSLVHIKRNSYYGGGAEDGTWISDSGETTNDITLGADAYGVTTSPSFVIGSDFSFELFRRNELLIGASYQYDKVDDFYPIINDMRGNTNSIFGAYIQDDWNIIEPLDLILGFRLDKNNKIDNLIFSPRAAVKYSISDPMAIRLSYSGGYRAPGLFDEDYHIEAGIAGDPYPIVNATNLSPEYSHSFTLSYDYSEQFENYAIEFGIAGYYTHIKDLFVIDESGTTRTRRNEETAMVAGGELSFAVNIKEKIEAGIGYTYLYTDAGGERITGTPDMFGNFQIKAQQDENSGIYGIVAGEYLGTMELEHVTNEEADAITETTSPILTLDLKVGYKIPVGSDSDHYADVYLGVDNVLNAFQPDFDTGDARDAGYVYGPRSGRLFYVGSSLTF